MSNILHRIQKRVFRYELWLALLLLCMPVILIAFDSGTVRPSISNYAYMQNSHIYVFLLTVAASLFAFNGALWVKRYNIILGICLAGVVLTPHLQYPIVHFAFAGLFFAISTFVMVYFSSTSQRKYKIAAAILIITAIALHFTTKAISLFTAEWLGIIPIAIHFIGESAGKID